MQTPRDFLGTGLRFPLQASPAGRIATSSTEQRVEESIYLILGTRLGERVMLPDFGCAIHDLAFEPNNAATRTRAIDAVSRSLVLFEPRIDVLEVTAMSAPDEANLLLVRVDYRLRSNNAIGNVVYPFYLLEAS
ncbi:MAG TPA: GPW/gp25 family protein [Rhodanobacteraceae bacterium]|nr:GPW/gp25 family protein [Rhodanobacteraceae bacterium]